jgi:hypothetical protein
MVKNIRIVVSTGYYNLPLHLKDCLLYITIFPENFGIRQDRLVWRWIAEGFVHPGNEQGERVFHLGQSNFYDIVNKSMIQFLDIYYSDDGYRDECCCSESFPDGFHQMLVKSRELCRRTGRQPTSAAIRCTGSPGIHLRWKQKKRTLTP